jgi:hypothetical protein
VGISYFGGPLYREETYKKAEEFGPDYFLVSDLSLNSMNIFGLDDLTCGRNMTHDKEWVWKNTNKVFRGQTLITRTIHRDIFLNTYRQVCVPSVPRQLGVLALECWETRCLWSADRGRCGGLGSRRRTS